MDQKNNNLKFKNVIGHKPINNSINLNNERNLVKSRIMNKYNVSSKEADKILFELEKRNENRVKIKNIQKDYSQNDLSLDDEHVLNKENFNKNAVTQQIESNKNKIPFGLDKPNVVERVQDENNGIIINEQSNQKIGLIPNKQITNENEVVFRDAKEKGNVDSILEEIIPNYNQQISINLEHVDLTFEVQNEKIDTIKEKVIRTLKRNNSKKIKIHALNDVSFKIYKGEKVGIIGYNGAGKSTLLNLIAGIYPPDNGTVTTCGNISPLLSLGAGFDPNFSGRKNIILNGAILGYDKDFLESKIDEIIEFSELGEFIDIPIKNYSSGMLAKLGFSIATFVNPDILIIDEILGVGDVNFQKKSSDKIRSLMDGGTTVLFVSHSIPQVRSICDKAIWINNGCVRAFGEVNKICDMYLEDAERASRQQLENINLY